MPLGTYPHPIPISGSMLHWYCSLHPTIIEFSFKNSNFLPISFLIIIRERFSHSGWTVTTSRSCSDWAVALSERYESVIDDPLPVRVWNVLKWPQKYGDLYWPTCSARCNHIFRRAQQKFVNPLHVVTRKPMMEIRFCIFAPQEHIYSSLVTRPSKAQFDIAWTKK